MNNWILSQIAAGLPYGVAFEEAGGEGGGGEGNEGGEGGGEGNEPLFSYAENVPGEGEAPAWFKGDKYANVSAQAEAYTALESKFGAFTGAPEEYEVNVSDELKEKGVEFDPEDVMMAQAKEFAKEAGMNQEGFNGLVNLYGMVRTAEAEAMEGIKADEMKALGQNAQGRIDNILKWGNANFSEEQVAGLNDMAMTANAVKTIEAFIAKSGAAPLSPDGNATPGGISEAELKEMQFAVDEHGNRKIQTDKAFKAEYDKKMKLFYGEGDHSIVIG